MRSTTSTTSCHRGPDLPALRSLGYFLLPAELPHLAAPLRRRGPPWPNGRFCGYLAQLQLELGGDFASEQPEPSWLCDEPPWPEVLVAPGVDKVICDQRPLGLRDRHGGILMKTTGLVPNAPEFLEQFANLRCLGKRTHVHVEGHNSFDAQIWPWKMAERLA